MQKCYNVDMGLFRKKPKHKPSLFEIENVSDFNLELREVLIFNRPVGDEKFLANLNHPQRVLALCMLLEDYGQTDTILNFFDEFPSYWDEAVKALAEVGAVKSSELIKRAIELLPKDRILSTLDWGDLLTDEMSKIDDEFACYPDGLLDPLHKKYAEKHREEILNF